MSQAKESFRTWDERSAKRFEDCQVRNKNEIKIADLTQLMLLGLLRWQLFSLSSRSMGRKKRTRSHYLSNFDLFIFTTQVQFPELKHYFLSTPYFARVFSAVEKVSFNFRLNACNELIVATLS